MPLTEIFNTGVRMGRGHGGSRIAGGWAWDVRRARAIPVAAGGGVSSWPAGCSREAIVTRIALLVDKKPTQSAPEVFAVGGGKGGVGKSIFSVALACSLAESGKRVVLVDLDLGAANLHTYLGMHTATPSLADFLTRKVAQLSEVMIPTPVNGLQLVSGAEYVPGMANLPHWMKQKLLRHIRTLPVDAVVLDLGAGVAFNTLDFFAVADHGIVLTAPEPAAVMNAYGFIKSALFRQLQQVFRKHDVLGPLIEEQARLNDAERQLTLEWLGRQVHSLAPDEASVLDEIRAAFQPHLIVNRGQGDSETHVVQNLIKLCRQQLGVQLQQQCVLPETQSIRLHTLDIPGFLRSTEGAGIRRRVAQWLDMALVPEPLDIDGIKQSYSDDDIASLLKLLDELDDFTFAGTNRKSWKLRLYFKPAEVVEFLLRRGVKEPQFLQVAVA